MQILVYKETNTDEDGTSHETWHAQSLTHAVGATGDTAKRAAADFVRWLKKSADDDSETVPYLTDTFVEAATTPLPDLSDFGDADDLANFGFEHGAEVVNEAKPEPIYKPQGQHVVEMWKTAVAYKEVKIPDGWEIRIVEAN